MNYYYLTEEAFSKLPELYLGNLLFFEFTFVMGTYNRSVIKRIEHETTNSYAFLYNLNDEDLTHLKLLGVDLYLEDRPGYTLAYSTIIKNNYIEYKVDFQLY